MRSIIVSATSVASATVAGLPSLLPGIGYFSRISPQIYRSLLKCSFRRLVNVTRLLSFLKQSQAFRAQRSDAEVPFNIMTALNSAVANRYQMV